jgi:hypothetical protein
MLTLFVLAFFWFTQNPLGADSLIWFFDLWVEGLILAAGVPPEDLPGRYWVAQFPTATPSGRKFRAEICAVANRPPLAYRQSNRCTPAARISKRC